VLTLCSACIAGEGARCHTPGCALIRNRCPDFSIRDSCDVESIDGLPFDYETLKRATTAPAPPSIDDLARIIGQFPDNDPEWAVRTKPEFAALYRRLAQRIADRLGVALADRVAGPEQRRAPVQANRELKKPPGTIAWSEHVEAWEGYARRYGTGQSAERIAERCGFCFGELVEFLGREPSTWEPRR
jgi:hypothetical protein